MGWHMGFTRLFLPDSSHAAADLPAAVTWIGRVRWLMLLAGASTAFACRLWGNSLPWLWVTQALLVLAVVNSILGYWLTRTPDALWVIRCGLLADVAVLTELLSLTGGAMNPFASLYLPPVLFAALLSPGWFAWGLSLLSLCCYGVLFFLHLPWPISPSNAYSMFSLHLLGMWGTFAVSAVLITGFVSWLARQLHAQEAALAAARETQLRGEQLVAVGVQAAGMAHSLSTPMNTLTLLVDELLDTYEQPAELVDDLLLMQAQVSVCRDALQRLKHGVEKDHQCVPLFATLAEQLTGWRSLRPDVRLEWHAPADKDVLVMIEPVLWPALFNLINNAAEAGGHDVMVSAMLQDGVLIVDIINREGCLTEEQLQRAGLAPMGSSKPAGLGLGMMLSHATLAKLGGSLSLSNREEGGVHARVWLPVTLHKV